MIHTLFYKITHFLLGGFSIKYKIIIPLFLIYQFIQLCLNIRYFVLENKCKKGNTVKHTTFKIFDFVAGFIFFQMVDFCIFEVIKKI